MAQKILTVSVGGILTEVNDAYQRIFMKINCNQYILRDSFGPQHRILFLAIGWALAPILSALLLR